MPDVVIGMDPHKHSATIEIIDTRERVLEHGRFATTTTGYRAMLAAGRRYPRRRWAIEGCNGIGRHIAQRLVADGEKVVDVPSKLSAQVRVFATGQGRTTDPIDAHSVAVAALRSTGLREVAADDATVALRLLVDRRDSLGRTRTDLVNRLHVFLLDLIPGGAKKDLSARQARALLSGVAPTASSPVSLLAAVLSSGGPWAAEHEATLLTTTTDLNTLLETTHSPTRLGLDRLHSAATLTDALNDLERHLLHRARLAAEHDTADLTTTAPPDPDSLPLPPIVLLTTAPAGGAATRLVAILTVGARLAITGVLLGAWPPGATWQVNPDGTTHPHQRPDTTGPRLNMLTSTATADILDTLAQAHPTRADTPPPPAPATPAPPTWVPAPPTARPDTPVH